MILVPALALGQTEVRVDLTRYFGKADAGFYLLDLKTGKSFIYNPQQCSTRYSPCSTFKIANSLIGIETGVVSDSAFVIPWDSVLHKRDKDLINRSPYKFWYQDLSLKQAFRYSSVWYFQELARRVGETRMKKMVEDLNYGNEDISGGIDTFWLCSSLLISIEEQVDFLRRLYEGKLIGISFRSIQIVKENMVAESQPGFRLYGKSGTGDCTEDCWIAWYVGIAETDSGAKVFAWNVIMPDYASIQKINRVELTKKILREIGQDK
jgi:beta-lactamase class D